MKSKKKLRMVKNMTHTELTFKEELLITIIDQIGPVVGGALTLAAAWIERKTVMMDIQKEEEEKSY